MKCIVDYHETTDIIGLPCFHELGSGHLDQVHVDHADDRGRPDGGHKGPRIYAGVSQIDHQIVVGILFIITQI